MNIQRLTITIADLIAGYEEKGPEGVEGVVAYGGKLDVRPAYQREYIYPPKDRDEVIKSVLKKFPINVMYWAKTGEDHYELMDGQQRTISICRYAAEGQQTFAIDTSVLFGIPNDVRYYFNLPAENRKDILAYPLDIYVCDGQPSEILAWFKVINIAGMKLSDQELRNTSYTGPWLSDAKLFFSKPNCVAYNLAKDYMNGSPIRQELLETALSWAADKDGLASIEDYMALHQKDPNANALRIYFKDVVSWIENYFKVRRKEMKGVEWGLLYNKFKDAKLDPDDLETQIQRLMLDRDVTNKKGIYDYVLTKDERSLNIREFDEQDKREAYERQKGICPLCNKHFEFEEMQGDHIIPWHSGGKTVAENCQMLCQKCNGTKSGK